MKKHVSKDMIQEAIRDLYDKEFEFFDSLDYPHEFSKEFDNKIHRMAQRVLAEKVRNSFRKTRSTRVRRKVIAAVLVILLTVFTTVMSVEALRTEFFQIITKFFNDFSRVEFQNTSKPTTADEFVEYEIAVPENFLVVYEYVLPEMKEKHVRYESKNNSQYIFFTQMEANERSIDINAGEGEIEVFIIDGMEMRFYSSKGIQNLVWNNKEYCFILSGNIDKDTLISLVKMTKIK